MNVMFDVSVVRGPLGRCGPLPVSLGPSAVLAGLMHTCTVHR